MRINALKMTGLCLLCFFVLVQATTAPPSSYAVKATSCPTPNDFHFEWDDFGWTGGSCYYENIKEKYLVFHGSSFTQPVDIEVRIDDESPTGSSFYTFWVTVYPGQTRFYLGQDQIQWNDMDCNESQDWGEMSYHTYSLTGQYDCTP